jgi:glucuronoarabinoxylan endo-1,4-beta-xylanase
MKTHLPYYLMFFVLVGLLVPAFIWDRVNSVAAITINWNSTYQTIDGFGASATGYTGSFSAAKADKFFEPVTGLGLSLLRLSIVPDTVNEDCTCEANSAPSTCVAGSKSQIVAGDLQVAQLAVARGVSILAAPWSPPPAMKSSRTFCAGGSLIGNSFNYAAYAAALASFPALLEANRVSISALSIQNEPDVTNDGYNTCTWTAQQIHDFIPYLSSALGAAGFGSIKIAIPEESNWGFELMKTAIEDPRVAQDVKLIFGHAYGVDNPSNIPSTNGRHVWQTEVGDSSTFDGGMTNAMKWAVNIHNYMSIGANAWMYWNLDCGVTYFNHDINMCLTDNKSNLAKRAYVLGQYSKFIRPGWRRIEATNSGSLLVTAYKGPADDFAIVVINTSPWIARHPSFNLNRTVSQRFKITPWITSTSFSLSPQPAIFSAVDGTTFAYTIPPNSVVTFQGRVD